LRCSQDTGPILSTQTCSLTQTSNQIYEGRNFLLPRKIELKTAE
jgi:hypothetical protein